MLAALQRERTTGRFVWQWRSWVKASLKESGAVTGSPSRQQHDELCAASKPINLRSKTTELLLWALAPKLLLLLEKKQTSVSQHSAMLGLYHQPAMAQPRQPGNTLWRCNRRSRLISQQISHQIFSVCLLFFFSLRKHNLCFPLLLHVITWVLY